MTPSVSASGALQRSPAPSERETDSPAFYDPSVQLIIRAQQPSGAINWESGGGKSDPWDMVEAAMGLAIAGQTEDAWRAYGWLMQQQLADGSLWAQYLHGKPDSDRRETHHAAYMAVGLWHQWCITGDRKRFEHYWPAAVRGLEFALGHQSEMGEIAWAVGEDGQPRDDALVTACSSLCKSLECGIAGEAMLGRDRLQWRRARENLLTALRSRPQRFDRNWPSKQRYSMDWFYPILCGVCSEEQGRARLAGRWDTFVQPQMGCRCVSDEPWVTVAESCELVMALCSLGQQQRAEQVFDWLHRHRDDAGRYWTGYVWPDRAFWPEEQPSWTAGAVLLAADALYKWTPACEVLTGSQLP